MIISICFWSKFKAKLCETIERRKYIEEINAGTQYRWKCKNIAFHPLKFFVENIHVGYKRILGAL
jgi:hypothetical protein